MEKNVVTKQYDRKPLSKLQKTDDKLNNWELVPPDGKLLFYFQILKQYSWPSQIRRSISIILEIFAVGVQKTPTIFQILLKNIFIF